MINDSDIKDSDIYFLESDFYSNNKKIINQLCDQVIPDDIDKLDYDYNHPCNKMREE